MRAPRRRLASVQEFNVHGNHAPREQISHHLQQAIENLQREALRVEIWAAALSGFARPIPSYEPTDDNLLPSSEDVIDDEWPPRPDQDVKRQRW